MLNSGCDTNTDWVESISSDDAVLTSGTTCAIVASGNAIFWAIITVDTDATDGTGLFFITDGTTTDTSTTTTFTTTQLPDYVIILLDVFESSSTTLETGTAICLDVDLESGAQCNAVMLVGNTYRFEVAVNNTGAGTGSPTIMEIRSSVGNDNTLGNIVAGNILDSGCSTNTNWVESISGGTDAVATSGTTCSIAAGGGPTEYWMIITIEAHGLDDSSTFFITDGVSNDLSTLTAFLTHRPPDGVSTLTALNPSFATVDLSWTQPFLGGGTLVGYQINFTTPLANPTTALIINST